MKLLDSFKKFFSAFSRKDSLSPKLLPPPGKGGDLRSGLEIEGPKGIKEQMSFFFKILTNRKFRDEQGLPWLQQVLKVHWHRIKQEVGESEEMLFILWKYANGMEVSPEERQQAKDQLIDIIRLVPALAIFLLPGGLLLLPLVAKALPWDILPSSFRKKNINDPSSSPQLPSDEKERDEKEKESSLKDKIG